MVESHTLDDKVSAIDSYRGGFVDERLEQILPNGQQQSLCLRGRERVVTDFKFCVKHEVVRSDTARSHGSQDEGSMLRVFKGNGQGNGQRLPADWRDGYFYLLPLALEVELGIGQIVGQDRSVLRLKVPLALSEDDIVRGGNENDVAERYKGSPQKIDACLLEDDRRQRP